jgi:hypothetical protein
MNVNSFPVVSRQPRLALPGHAVRPVLATRVVRLMGKEMSSVRKNQDPAWGAKTLTTQAIDVSRVRLDLRQGPFS